LSALLVYSLLSICVAIIAANETALRQAGN
jgi:hypothetical protein